MNKLCSKCKIEKPYTEFLKHKNRKYGLRSNCKTCMQQYRITNAANIRKYRLDNLEILKEKAKQYRIDNAEKLKEYDKQYRIKNVDKKKQSDKQRYIKKFGTLKEKSEQPSIVNVENKKKYYQLHKTELCEKKRQYYILNAIKIKDRVNKRYQLNKIAINEKNKKYTQTPHGKAVKRMCEHRRRALLKNNTPVGKNFTADDLIMKLKLQNNRCVYCNINISNCYEVEHFIPISKGGSNEPSNIQLLCQNCNRGIDGKHSKLPYEYAQKHGKLF